MGAESRDFEELYENAPMAYFTVDREGTIREANLTAAIMLGRPLHELVGQPALALYADTAAGKEKARQVFERFRRGEEIRDEELEMRHAEGRSVWISLNVRAVRDDGGRVIESRSMALDITRRRRAEAELRAREDYLRAIFEHSNDAIFVIDPARNSILDANPAACSLLGYSREELRDLPISAIHPDEMPRLQAFARSVLEREKGWTDELSCTTRSGSRLPSEISASRIAIEGKTCIVAHRAVYTADPRRRAMGTGSSFPGRRKDGGELSLDISLSPVRLGEDVLTIASIRKA